MARERPAVLVAASAADSVAVEDLAVALEAASAAAVAGWVQSACWDCWGITITPTETTAATITTTAVAETAVETREQGLVAE